MTNPTDDPRFLAAVDMLRRTGARSTQIRYSDDEEPTVWFIVVEHYVDEDGRPVPDGGTQRFETAAALDPLKALFRLCSEIIDGGFCTHCSRPTGLVEDHLDPMPRPDLFCWYQFDPELKTFRRSCEGNDR